MESVPLTSSDALTVTAVPLAVPAVTYPAVLVTIGVTVMEWFDTVPLDALAVAPPVATVAEAYVVTSFVPAELIESVPLTNSLADTVTPVPVFVPPVM